jgi:hypothetical protein
MDIYCSSRIRACKTAVGISLLVLTFLLVVCATQATPVVSPVPPFTLKDFKFGDYDTHLPVGEHLIRYWISDPEAKCNDGTRTGIYVRAGNAENRDKWIVYLQGGGSCGGRDESVYRALNESI